MIALSPSLQAVLAEAIRTAGVVATKDQLGCDEQTMMRAAVGVPLRDEVAKRIAQTVKRWK